MREVFRSDWTGLKRSPITHPLDLIGSLRAGRQSARIAQLVEQRIENPRVAGSNPAPGTTFSLDTILIWRRGFPLLLASK